MDCCVSKPDRDKAGSEADIDSDDAGLTILLSIIVSTAKPNV